MPTPNPINHHVQRCRELAEGIKNAAGVPGVMSWLEERSDAAMLLLPHLAAVLAELERLREGERDYLNLLHLEHGERTDD